MKLVKSCIIFSLKEILSNRWLEVVLFLGIVLGTYFNNFNNIVISNVNKLMIYFEIYRWLKLEIGSEIGILSFSLNPTFWLFVMGCLQTTLTIFCPLLTTTPCWHLWRNSFWDEGKSTYRWHFQYHLPTSSCHRSLWMPPYIFHQISLQ